MTWVDLTILGLLLISGLLAFARGLVREVLGIGAWAGAVAVAIIALPIMRPIVAGWFTTKDWVDPVAFVVTFLGSLIVLMIFASMMGRLVRGSALGGIDRTLGLLYGLARGALIVIIAYILGQMVFPTKQWPESVAQARLAYPTYDAATWVVGQLPEAYRPKTLDPPPAGREATSEALLHASPQGRATGKQPERE